MDSKIIFVIAICFFIIIISLYYFNEWHRTQYDLDKSQENWYGKKFDSDRKKIFIIGSSYVKSFNSTYLEKTLSQNGYEYDVYNLGVQNDKVSKRVKYVDSIISSNPDVVILGVSYDLTIGAQGTGKSILLPSDLKPQSTLPDPEESFTQLFEIDKFFGIDFSNFENPKLTSLQFIDILFGKNLRKYDLNSKEPFMGGEILERVRSYEEIKKEKIADWWKAKSPDPEHKNVNALKEMIKKFEENEIKVIVYAVPFHDLFWDQVGKSNENDYVIILNNLSNELELTIYDYHNHYSDFGKWNDSHHLARIPDNLFYTDDLSKIILKEME